MGDTSKMTLSVCVWCSDIYLNGNTHFHKKGFCSEECRSAYIETTRNSIKEVEKTAGSKVCTICYSLFHGEGTLCSSECHEIYCESHGCFQQRVKFYLKCHYCGEFIEVRFNLNELQQRMKSKYIFCGRKCKDYFYSGENHPSYIAGKSRHYCSKWNEDLRTRVRAFFRDTCFMCDKTEEELGERLCVHHVNYDKRACCNDRRPLFVALCKSCHAKTNNKRKNWEEFFERKLKEVYNYKCFYSKAEYRHMMIEKYNHKFGEFEEFEFS